MSRTLRFCSTALVVVTLAAFLGVAAATAQTQTYTTTADFECPPPLNSDCTGINVTTAGNEVKLINVGEAFDFVWVAASNRGTIVKIDANTGAVLGEYLSAPDNRGRDPSRTTVDANGNVWAGNRAESSGNRGSVVHVGLVENGQCVDRHGPGGIGPPDGVIQTSTALGNVLDWNNAGGADDNGGVSTAVDECIIHYVRTSGTNVRTVAVDGSNNVWVGGLGNRVHELYDANGNVVAGTQFNLGCGGYGGLVDGNGILWSASLSFDLLRYDPSGPSGVCINIGRTSYGLGIDTNGFIWHSNFGFDTILKIAPPGAPIVGPFTTFGGGADRGVAVTPVDNNVWVANSGGDDVSRLDNNGTFITAIAVDAANPPNACPTGVAVDGNGKVWATNLCTHTVSRIDPGTNLEDLVVDLDAVKYNNLNAGPYNYSDMTGSTLTAPPSSGTWSVIYDTGASGTDHCRIFWNDEPEGAEPGTTSITVEARAADVDPPGGAFVAVTYGADTGLSGQFYEVRAKLDRGSETAPVTPVLSDLTIRCNAPPECDDAIANPDRLWPPNHKFHAIDILRVTDPDGDPVTITVTSIFQDEPVDTFGDGRFSPDGMGVGTATAHVRAERSGTKKVPGDGRVYHIGFTADDGQGGECTGTVTVCVPHDQRPGSDCVDQGPRYNSTLTAPKAGLGETPNTFTLAAYPNPFNPATTLAYTLPEAAHVRLAVYDVTGRAVAQLVDATVAAGAHEVVFDATSLPSGIYLVRLEAGGQVVVRSLTLLK